MTEPAPDRDAPMPLAVEDLLCFGVYSLTHAFNRVYKPLLAPLGLTYPQYLVMLALWVEDDQTIGRLGERLTLESNTLTPLIKRLEAAGHLLRSRDTTDERQVRVRLTEQGSELRHLARGIPACILEATQMSLEQALELHSKITELRKSLER